MNLEQFFHEALAVLWSIPLALGVMMLIRMLTGRPTLSEKESLLFFGVSKEQVMTARFTIRSWIAFIAFFVAAYLEHEYLTQFGFGLFVLAYISTLIGMLVWLRGKKSCMVRQSCAELPC